MSASSQPNDANVPRGAPNSEPTKGGPADRCAKGRVPSLVSAKGATLSVGWLGTASCQRDSPYHHQHRLEQKATPVSPNCDWAAATFLCWGCCRFSRELHLLSLCSYIFPFSGSPTPIPMALLRTEPVSHPRVNEAMKGSLGHRKILILPNIC